MSSAELEMQETVVPDYDTGSGSASLEEPADLAAAPSPLRARLALLHARTGTTPEHAKLAGAACIGLGLLAVVLAFALGDGDGAVLVAPPGDPSDPPAARARQVLALMTLEEKTRLLRGEGESIFLMAMGMFGLREPRPCGECPYGDQAAKNYDRCMSGHVCGNARLKIPTIRMNDGPQGFRAAAPVKPHPTAFWAAIIFYGLLIGSCGCCCGTPRAVRKLKAMRLKHRAQLEDSAQEGAEQPVEDETQTKLLQAALAVGATSLLILLTGIGTVTYKMPDTYTTAFPAALSIAASFDVSAAEQWGDAMGAEFYGMGCNMALGPGLSLARIPHNGRNFEYLSGEDPYLGSQLAGPAVAGLQRNKVIATAKHYVDNSQEIGRWTQTEVVDERSQWELYYPPFKGAVDAGLHSIMCSYNKIQLTPGQSESIYSCGNSQTLQHDLKDAMGFDGFTVSDWGATHSMSIAAGLDIEMPGAKCNWLLWMLLPADFELFGGLNAACTHLSTAHIISAIENDELELAKLDDSVMRILTALFAIGEFDEPNPNSPEDGPVTSAEHHAIAAELAASGTVLLKNDGDFLPIRLGDAHGVEEQINIALIGHEALGTTIGGGGSGGVSPSNFSTPKDLIRRRAGITGNSDCTASGNVCVRFQNVQEEADIELARKLALRSTHVFVFVATDSMEGADRDNLSLESSCQTEKMSEFGMPVCDNTVQHENQDALIDSVVEVAGRKTAVIAVAPGALLTPWAEQTAAVLISFMPGQAYAEALTAILFGDFSPSARLPITFPASEGQQVIPPAAYPGLIDGNEATPMPRPCTGPMAGPFPTCPDDGISVYSERLEVGYRWFEAHDVTPAFCFGHGMSFTQFSYGELDVRSSEERGSVAVTFSVTNAGSVAGKETPQLYLRFPADAGEPPKQLKGFSKTANLAPGASELVTLTLVPRDMSIWDVRSHRFVVSTGEFEVMVGASSCDIRQRATVTVEG